MIVIISNLLNTLTVSDITKVSCHAQSEGYSGDKSISNFIIEKNGNFDEEFVNSLEDMQYTDCKISFGKNDSDVNGIYLDEAEFTIVPQKNELWINGGDFRWA